MDWIDSASKLLKIKFSERAFSTAEALKLLRREKGYSAGTVYRFLHELTKRGHVSKLGRGLYRMSSESIEVTLRETISVSAKVTVEFTSGPLMEAEKVLKRVGIDFMITGPSTLTRYHHHLPRRLIHLIYVIKGAGETATESLTQAGQRPLLNPSTQEIKLALEMFPDRDIFVVREFSELKGNSEGRATPERALVDTYFEGTRERIPYPKTEIGHIIINALRDTDLRITRLLSLANRRNVAPEFKAILKELMPDLPVEGAEVNKHVVSVLQALDKVR